MFKNFLPILAFLLTGATAMAQTPENIAEPKEGLLTRNAPTCMGKANAGLTTRTLGLKAKSKNARFLCKNDSLFLTNRNRDLSEDQNLSTPAGIAYLFYTCPPTIKGDSFPDVRKDNCLFITNKSVTISRGDLTGRDTFSNNGSLQNTFNSGKPIKFYFAPVTLTDFNGQGTLPGFDNRMDCINVTTEDWTKPGAPDSFSVVYLNEVKITNLVLGTRAGSFKIEGGLPEYDGATNYTLTIQKVGTPSVKGVISGTPTNGATITFTVPSDGEYEIVATDNVSCDASRRIAFPNVDMTLSNEQVNTGATACVKFTVKNFNDIAAAQFLIGFDPTLLSNPRIQNFNPALAPAPSISPLSAGNYIFSWNTSSATNSNLPDASLFFELCFTAIGANGTISPVRIVDTSTVIFPEIGNGNDVFGLTVNQGSVKIGKVPVTFNLSADSVPCKKGADGQLRIKPTSVGIPFAYKWSNTVVMGSGSITSASDSAVVKVAAGTYSVTVYNAANDSLVKSIAVGEPTTDLKLRSTVTALPCKGQSNGKIRMFNNTGGTAPYTYKWSPINSTTDSLVNVPEGSYTCTITDARGCEAVNTETLFPNPIVIGLPTIVKATCKDVANGSITIPTVSGGSPTSGNYTFKWSTGKTNFGGTSNIGPVGAGIYRVTVSDGTGNCDLIDSTTLIIPADRTLFFTAATTVTSPTCNGGTNGSIFAVVGEIGTAKLPYTSTSANFTTNGKTFTAATIPTGSYPLSIRDADGCTLDSTFRLSQPAAIKIDSVSLKNETCSPGSDGSITVSASGGNGEPFAYLWNGVAANNSATIANITAGNYRVQVKDSKNCSEFRAFNVTVPLQPKLTFSTVDATCAGKNNGSAKVTAAVAGAVKVDSYKWSNTSVLDNVSNVVAGKYTVQVTFNNGCTKDTFVTINQPDTLLLGDSIKINPSCSYATNGSIKLTAKGGTPPYTFTNEAGQQFPSANTMWTFASLKGGKYNFGITDSKGCPKVDVKDVTLIAPDSIKLTFPPAAIVATSCALGSGTDNDGRATVIPTKGVSTGYTFKWAAGSTVATAQGLKSGWQLVTVNDGDICPITDSVFVPEPQRISLIPTFKRPTCFDDKNGSVSVQPNGGTPGYTYFWTNINQTFTATTPAINNVKADSFIVVITDAKGCKFNSSVVLEQPTKLQLDTIADETNEISCHGFKDGQISLVSTGGADTLITYTWSPNVSQSNKARGLKAGIYRVIAANNTGCRDTLIYELTEPPFPIRFTPPKFKDPLCFGTETTVSVDTAYGNTGLYPYTISVDNGPGYPLRYEIPVFAGEHLITFTEQNTGCSDTITINISQPPQIEITFNKIVDANPVPRMVVGLGDSVRIDPVINVQGRIDSISWTPRKYLTFLNDSLRPFVRPLDDQTYTLRVKDVNGCLATADIFIELERNRNVFIPNVFSPNGDDKNDYFGVFTGVGVKFINYVRIFDRWGEFIYEAKNLTPNSDPALGWNGTFNGSPLMPGVFVYLIEVVFEDGQVLLYRGDVTLIK